MNSAGASVQSGMEEAPKGASLRSIVGSDPNEVLAAIRKEKERRGLGASTSDPAPVQVLAVNLQEMGGTASEVLNKEIVGQAIRTIWSGNSTPVEHAFQVAATTDALRDIAPKDAIEGMLSAQMLATHNAAMECFRRAMLPEQTHVGRESSLGHANRLTRSFATLLHALDKHRGKGQQTVRVEHVHVHEGGQAIVGAVTHGGQRPNDGGGRPHGKDDD